MTRTQTIATNYSLFTDPQFIELGQNILAGVEGNPYYPKPPQDLQDLAKMLEELSLSVKAMKTGLKAATQQRDYLRAQAEKAFKALSTYCTGATPDRPDLWAAANFPLTRPDATPRLPSLPVSGLALADGAVPRTLLATVDTQAGMYGYAWRIFPKSTPAVELAAGFCYRFCLTREPKATLDALESGTSYGVECAAWNNTGPLQWSAPVFRIVQ